MLQTCLPVLHGQAPSLGDIMNNNAIYNRIEEIIIIVLFILMTIITAMTVVTRFFFNFTLSWAEQFARLDFIRRDQLGREYQCTHACYGSEPVNSQETSQI